MSRMTFLAALAGVALTLASGTSLSAQSGYDLFQKALATERADGDLRSAILLYERIVKEQSADRALVARALVRMGECHQKLGTSEARAIYERVVREFGDQAAAVAEARSRLAALPSPAIPSSGIQAARLVWTGPDVLGAVRGMPTGDGRYLPFLNAAGGLGLRDLRDGTTRTLSNESGTFFYAVPSPDGRQVAYAWTTQTGKAIRMDLRVIPTNADAAAQPRVVYRSDETTQIRPFDWTPDGRELLVLRGLKDGTNQIALISVRDGSLRVLKSLPWSYITMSLSPDGRYVAYDAVAGTTPAPTEILVLSTDGSRETRAVAGPSTNNSPRWTPDGSRLLFLSNRTGNTSLWAVEMRDGLAQGAAELIRPDLGQVRLLGFSRSGTLYYLAAGVTRTNIYVSELEARSPGAPPASPTERFVNANSAPRWSPDGQQLAYLSSRGQRGVELSIRTLSPGEERDIPLPNDVQTGNLVPSPRWFSDNRSVLVRGSRLREAIYYRVNVETGVADAVHTAKGASGAGGLGAAEISPDARTLYLITAVDESSPSRQVVRVDLGDHREQVLVTGDIFMALALSPDGQELAFTRSDANGCSLEVVPSSGGQIRTVVRVPGCGNPNQLTWSPDQRDLLFVTGNSRSAANVLWRVPAAGGQATETGISMAGQLMYPHVHPDGRRVTFGSFDTGASEVWALENFLPKSATR